MENIENKSIESESIKSTENIKINRCKYCMCEIDEGYFCCRSCFEDFEE